MQTFRAFFSRPSSLLILALPLAVACHGPRHGAANMSEAEITEHMQDIAEFDSSSAPAAVSLYQLKKKENGYWKAHLLTGQTAKSKVPVADSPLMKLIGHVRSFKSIPAKGAFVSKWTVRKADLAVLKGEDLGKQAVLWNTTTSAYDAPNTNTVFQRFCSADLAAPSAFFYAAGNVGYDAPLFLNGEESGTAKSGTSNATGDCQPRLNPPT